MSSSPESSKKQKTGDELVQNAPVAAVKNDDRYRDCTEEELQELPGKYWNLSKIEPDLQNGGTRVLFEIHPSKYEALETKWCWVQGWIGGKAKRMTIAHRRVGSMT